MVVHSQVNLGIRVFSVGHKNGARQLAPVLARPDIALSTRIPAGFKGANNPLAQGLTRALSHRSRHAFNRLAAAQGIPGHGPLTLHNMTGVLKRLVTGMHPEVAGDGEHTILAIAEMRVRFREFRLELFQAIALFKQPKRVIRQLPIGKRMGQDDGATFLKGRQQAADDRAHPTGID